MDLNDIIPSDITPTGDSAELAKSAGQVAALTLSNTHDPVKEIGYMTKRSTLMVAGKTAAEAAGEQVAALVTQESSISWSTAIATAIKGYAGLVTVGIAAAVSATLVQMDFIHRKDKITDAYKEELATRLHKPLNQVTREDLDTLEKENRVIGDEMKQIRKQRTIGVGLSFIATMAALSMVKIALPALADVPLEKMVTPMWFAAKALTGLITYNVVKEPLHLLADKLFHLEYNTTHDHIMALSKDREAGRPITREQVVSVFAAAHPEIDNMVAREFGKRFNKLAPPQKSQAAEAIAQIIPIDNLVTDINSGKVNVTELAFAVEGQISGVQFGRPISEKEGFLGSIVSSVKKMFGAKSDHNHTDKTQEHINALAKSDHTRNGIPPQPEANRVSHVQRMGRDRENTMKYVERLDQQRAEQATIVNQVS